jgi:RHS repeat-associated protein
VEYTPYGELWIEKASAASNLDIPYRFTGKERDGETGLYYYGARYLNPQTGLWLSVDPAMGEYVPQAPINEEAKKHNQNLPGMGGVYNYINLHVYHYAGNNPVKLTDPDGRIIQLDSNATDTEKQEYERTMAYLKTSEEGRKLIEKLENSPVIFTIVFNSNDDDSYESSTRTINWDATSGLVSGDKKSIQSAALGLAHEMGHGAQDLDKLLAGKTRSQIEADNLARYETPIAKQLGEPIRKSYNDISGTYGMNNSTHYRTTHNRPWWHYIAPWNWRKPKTYTKDHNAK